MPQGRSRKQCVETLEERLDWLREKRDARKASGEPWSYLTDEIVALEWVLPMAKNAVIGA